MYEENSGSTSLCVTVYDSVFSELESSNPIYLTKIDMCINGAGYGILFILICRDKGALPVHKCRTNQRLCLKKNLISSQDWLLQLWWFEYRTDFCLGRKKRA